MGTIDFEQLNEWAKTKDEKDLLGYFKVTAEQMIDWFEWTLKAQKNVFVSDVDIKNAKDIVSKQFKLKFDLHRTE